MLQEENLTALWVEWLTGARLGRAVQQKIADLSESRDSRAGETRARDSRT